MKIHKQIIKILLIITVLIAKKTNAQSKIRQTIMIDGFEREYYIEVPSGYAKMDNVPLVFMLHGTGGDGEKMYEQSGWAELAEKENFVAVFPSAEKYKIIDDGENKNITKWNITPDADWVFQAGVKGHDDIKFLRQIISKLKSTYRIDGNRVYLNGFSNGGAMAAKCAIEMSDLLAAVACNAGGYNLDTTYIPKKKLPVLYQIGNKDYGPGVVGPEMPMLYFDTVLTSPSLHIRNGKHYRTSQKFLRNFSMQQTFVVTGDSAKALIATYQPMNTSDYHEFKYIIVKGLAHSYPDWAPDQHWNWMKKYTLNISASVDNVYNSASNFSVYPNPFSDHLQCHVSTVNDQKVQFRLYDNKGNIVSKIDVVGNEIHQIDVCDLPAGLYYYQVTENGKSISAGKCVKSR